MIGQKCPIVKSRWRETRTRSRWYDPENEVRSKVPRKKAESAPKARTRKKDLTALDRLAEGELASVLRMLLKRHPELRSEAEAIAGDLVSSASADAIAEQVRTMMGWYDIDDLNQRSGDHGWGYVSPEEAADELLRGAIEDHLSEMTRKVQLGFYEAALAVCEGLLKGLYQARKPAIGSVLEWSPDFPLDAAIGVIADLHQACPPEVRPAVMEQLGVFVEEQTPEWAHPIARLTLR